MAENWTGSYDAASMTENLMMSTASPVVDPETKLPYSRRLQGSGLIDLSAATSSDVVLYTDADQYGDTKPVLDLGDDVAKNGSYDLTFHARNMGKDTAQYDVSVIAMSPAVLEQDGKTYMSSHDEALDVTVSGDKTVTLAAGATGDVKVSVSLSQSQKAKLDAAYENGIYVEGFVVLTAKDGSADLSIPFLAYCGDWSAPGMLDYATMLNEDTVPYSQLSTELGAYFTSSFAYRLGANLSVTMDGAEKTSLKAEHITISPNGDTYMDGVEFVNVSQMRNASALHFTVTNADGQEVWSDAVTNVPKTIYASSQGGPIPATMYQDMAPDAWYGTDNQGNALPDGQYYYTITADPVTDHESRNVRDTLTFPVYIDTQAPQLDQGRVTLSTGADGRTTLGMQVSDEHLYLDTEIFVANDDGTISTSSEKLLHKNVGLADMPDVTSDAVSVDVTDYAGKLLYVQLSDWGYNYAAYLVQLPDTFESTTLSLSDTTAFLFTGEQQHLLAFDTDTEAALTWTSSNDDVASVDENGLVTAKAPGVATVTATTANGASVTCDHDHTTRTETPATCTEDGSVTVICDDGDEVLSTETLPATGHSTVVKNAKDATCTEPGYTGDKVCTVCGETGETGEVIPAAGHSYKDGKCTVCGAADPNANSGGNTGNEATDSPNTADGAAMGLWLSLMTVAVLAGAVLVAGKTPRA